MPGAWFLLASMLTTSSVGPPPPELDPVLDPPATPATLAPKIEGPAPPPERPPPEPHEPEPREPSPAEPREPPPEPASAIELPPPPEDDEPSPPSPAAAEPAVYWPDPGHAPPDGSAAFVTAGVLMPTAAVVTWVLLRDPSLDTEDRIGIITAGVGMELIGVLGLSLGLYRRVKLVRWARAYRVRPTPQGSGLLAAGGLGLTAGLTLVPLGAVILANGTPSVGAALTIAGGVALGIVTPVCTIFGVRQRRSYQATGGWIRAPWLPTSSAPGPDPPAPAPAPAFGLAPLITRHAVGLSVAGQF